MTLPCLNWQCGSAGPGRAEDDVPLASETGQVDRGEPQWADVSAEQEECIRDPASGQPQSRRNVGAPTSYGSRAARILRQEVPRRFLITARMGRERIRLMGARVSVQSKPATFRTLDGLHLVGAIVTSDGPPERAVILVHGGGVTREEGGFFTRLAGGLGEVGVASLRFDLRGHGESEGRQEELTLATILNDIRVALGYVREETGARRLSLLGASFAGGVCAYYAARRPAELDRLVLLNPQLDYKQRTITSRPYWTDDQLSEEMARQLSEHAFIQFTPTLRHGRPILNEAFWFEVLAVLPEITAPTLVVHGTKDTFVSIDASREAVKRFATEHKLVEIEGAQHGFAVHDDPQYLNPQSQKWQAFVIRTVADWITAGS